MSYYNPQLFFYTPFILLEPTISKDYGVITNTYENKGFSFYANTRSGSTFLSSNVGGEKAINGLTVELNIVIVTTWYSPKITGNCKIQNAETNIIYDIITNIEQLNGRKQFIQFKARANKGGA